MENYVVLDSNEKVFVPSQRKQSLRPLFTMKYFYYHTYLSSYCSEIAGLHFCSHYFLANFKVSELFPTSHKDQQAKLSSDGHFCTQKALQAQLVAQYATLNAGT